jgi:hypothetical protein
VGSFSNLAIGTYAASANFHQPRDTTGARNSLSSVSGFNRYEEVTKLLGLMRRLPPEQPFGPQLHIPSAMVWSKGAHGKPSPLLIWLRRPSA